MAFITVARVTFGKLSNTGRVFPLYSFLKPTMCSVFIDREKLSSRYVPPKLPHRDIQLETLRSLVDDVIQGDTLTPRTVVLVGSTGTGKTSSVLLVNKVLESKHKHIFSYLNMRMEGETPFQIFSSLYEKTIGVPAPRNLSALELLKETLDSIRKSGVPTFLVFDEVEFHARSSLRSVLYTLTRLNEISPFPLQAVVVFIARGLDWLKLLDPAERSSLGNIVVKYPPYSREQLFDILSYRASEAFRSGAVSESVLKWLADYTFTYMNGDVRRALDTLFHAGVLADQKRADRVTLSDVVEALRNIETFIAPADVGNLTIYEKLLLFTVLRLAENKPYVKMSELRDEFALIIEQFDLEPVTIEEFEDLVQNLADMGALLAEGPARIAPAPSLNIEVLKQSLKIEEER